eukprot:137981_1
MLMLPLPQDFNVFPSIEKLETQYTLQQTLKLKGIKSVPITGYKYADTGVPNNGKPIEKNKAITMFLVLMVGCCIIMIVFEWFNNQQNTSIQLSQYIINTNINNYETYFELQSRRPYTVIEQTQHINRLQYVQLGSYIGIPNFYIKKGVRSYGYDDDLLTLCSVCSLNILSQAQTLATRYKSGPLSLAIYIDEDISAHTIDSETYLASLFDAYFGNLSTTTYDIYIGLVYVDTSSQFWIDLNYTPDTEMAWKIPVNAMRNLAESQVNSKWLLTVDVDFELYSLGINNPHYIRSVLASINALYSDHTMFIVPVFAINASYVSNATETARYSNLRRNELIALVDEQTVVPFYDGEPYQACTDYPRWYKATRDYPLALNSTQYCLECAAYEPFFILKSNVSKAFVWDSDFTGRHKDKIQRVQYLRYHNFSIVVMRHLFMIHVNIPHVKNFFPAPGTRDYYPINEALLKKANYFIPEHKPNCKRYAASLP